VTAFCFGPRVCLSSVVSRSRIRSRKLSEIGTKFRHLYRKSGPPSKNMTSDFAPKVAPNYKMAQNSVWTYCLAPLAMQLVECRHCCVVSGESVCRRMCTQWKDTSNICCRQLNSSRGNCLLQRSNIIPFEYLCEEMRLSAFPVLLGSLETPFMRGGKIHRLTVA